MSNNEIVNAAIAATLQQEGASYFERPSGSYLEGIAPDGATLVEMLKCLDWSDVTEHVQEIGGALGSCRYFRAELPSGVTGQQAICLLGNLPEDLLPQVRVRIGHHGELEMYVPRDVMPPIETTHVHMVVMDRTQPWPPMEGEVTKATALAVTWFPGDVPPGTIDKRNLIVKFGG